MLAEWVLLGNLKHKGMSLQACCERRGIQGKLDLVKKQIDLGIDPSSIPRNWLEEYCHVDVDITETLFVLQLDELRNRSLLHLVYQRGLVSACLADVEPAGLCLDRERVDEEYGKVFQEYVETKAKLETFGDINWRSSKQVAEFIYDTLKFPVPTDFRGNPKLTATGNRPVDKATLSSLRAVNKEQRDFLELFKKVANLNAKLSKNLEFFKGVCDKYECTFMGLLQHGTTQTHRLSSAGRAIVLSKSESGKEEKKGIQLQNIPREYKKLFKPKREGWLILEIDAAQLEFRVAADLGKDIIAKQEIFDEVDIHSNTAEFYVGNGTQPEFKGLSLKEARQPAKAQTFKPLFGGRGKTDAEKAYCKFFQDKYKGIYNEQTKWTFEVLKTGQLITDYGMIFYWPGTTMRANGYIENSTAIFDYPIQGFSTGEILPLTVTYLWHFVKDLRCELILTVHDSAILEVHPDDLEKVKEIAKYCFTTQIYKFLRQLYKYEFTTVLGGEMKWGSHWGQGEEEKFKYDKWHELKVS